MAAAVGSGAYPVEHGSNIHRHQAERMAAAGTAWCPTITLIPGFMDQEIPDPDYAKRVRAIGAGAEPLPQDGLAWQDVDDGEGLT